MQQWAPSRMNDAKRCVKTRILTAARGRVSQANAKTWPPTPCTTNIIYIYIPAGM